MQKARKDNIKLRIYGVILFSLTLLTNHAYGIQEIKFWVTPHSSNRSNYEIALLKHLLNSSTEKYGQFELNIRYMDFNYARANRELRIGSQVNVLSNPVNFDSQLGTDRPILIPETIMNGLLGYRELIIKNTNLDKFHGLDSFEKLKVLKPGQLDSWIDNGIYEKNNITLIEARDYDKLFDQLNRQRIDYIPLGAIEAKEILNRYQTSKHDLAISQNAVVYYPYNVYFQVTKSQPLIAERLSYAMKKAQEDGSFNSIFNKYYGSTLKALKEKELNVFILKNPNISNTEITKLNKYLPKAKLISQ
ncbi:MAG: hypothetical protein ACI93R_000511 [Flavobacteriales bacterium]|jgi:hypothetical protein